MAESEKSNPHIQAVEAALEQWQDNRLISREDIRVWYEFNNYLVNLAEADGWTYDGQSFTKKEPMSTLVVRGTHGNIPHVAFTSGRTATECMRSFLRKMREGWLEWSVDRYRQ